MPRIPSDFLDVGFTDDLQKTIASNINIMLYYWMNQTNLESNRYLKSDTFLDSFSEYVTSLIKLHSMTRGLSYPVTAMSSLLDKYSASAISRVLLEIQETPHEVVYKLDDVRLMHYLDLLNEKKAIKHNAPI